MLVSDTGLLKVTDFGTSRFLEIAVHGTTIIGSPPYMAPEQFHGKAVFASDVYSIGVTMYQMLTGTLPYATPSPADLERLMKGELVSSPRLRNPKIPKGIADIVMSALAPDADGALQPRLGRARRRAGGARETVRRPGRAGSSGRERRDVADIQSRLRARDTPQPALLLALPQAAAGPRRQVPVLRGNPVAGLSGSDGSAAPAPDRPRNH